MKFLSVLLCIFFSFHAQQIKQYVPQVPVQWDEQKIAKEYDDVMQACATQMPFHTTFQKKVLKLVRELKKMNENDTRIITIQKIMFRQYDVDIIDLQRYLNNECLKLAFNVTMYGMWEQLVEFFEDKFSRGADPNGLCTDLIFDDRSILMYILYCRGHSHLYCQNMIYIMRAFIAAGADINLTCKNDALRFGTAKIANALSVAQDSRRGYRDSKLENFLYDASYKQEAGKVVFKHLQGIIGLINLVQEYVTPSEVSDFQACTFTPVEHVVPPTAPVAPRVIEKNHTNCWKAFFKKLFLGYNSYQHI